MSDISVSKARKISGLPALTGAAFRAWRERHGFTQGQVAALLDLHVDTIANYEKTAGTLTVLLTLAVAHLNTILDKPAPRGTRGAA